MLDLSPPAHDKFFSVHAWQIVGRHPMSGAAGSQGHIGPEATTGNELVTVSFLFDTVSSDVRANDEHHLARSHLSATASQ
eukprot:SAG22_NODE_2509_length_2496_cov_1.317480_2_plen_80_part_00